MLIASQPQEAAWRGRSARMLGQCLLQTGLQGRQPEFAFLISFTYTENSRSDSGSVQLGKLSDTGILLPK